MPLKRFPFLELHGVLYIQMISQSQVEKLDISHTGDIVYVYLHRGAIVGGKEVKKYIELYVN